MKRLELAKRALMLVMCAALAVPVSAAAWTTMTAEASGIKQETETNPLGGEVKTANGMQKAPAAPQGEDTDPDGEEGTESNLPTEASEAEKKAVKGSIIDYYNLRKAKIKELGNEKAVQDALNALIGDINKPEEIGGILKDQKYSEGVSDVKSMARAEIDSYAEKPESEAPEEEPKPETTNSNIMVGGNWITPVANAGQHVSVVLPVVNMGRTRVKNAVVTPQISDDSSKWPFEIETSNYTQTIDRLPGTDEGGTDMERRRELTWILKTRKDAPSGYMPLLFDVTYENDDKSLTTVTLTTYVKVVGTTGVSADGKASTPRVIVTGFSTNPETVKAGETFTLTLHMQNTSKATAVKNLLFDIQAASESTDTTYVAAAFLPTAGSSTVFVDQIPAGGTKDISMEMEARSDLSQKPYVVNVTMNYEDENVNAYENTASVSIPVRQEARVDVSTIEVMPEAIEVGSDANVMFSIYNIGKTRLYNTTVKFVADSISGGDTYLGNIDPGATANVDAYLSGAAATMDDGTVKIEITYEDEAGEKATIEKTMTLYVNEMMMGDMDMGMMEDPMMEESGGFKIWYVIVPVVLVAAGVVIFVVIRRRKKKKAMEEDALVLEEDDLEEVDVTDEEEKE